MTTRIMLTAALLLGTTYAFLTPANRPSKYVGASATTTLESSRFVNFESSAAKQAGAGAAKVDMNQYNLPLETVVEEWTANLVAKSANTEGGVKLACKTQREILVDTVRVSFPRKPDMGLGILLQEIAGGREDGLGITLVSGLVEGGAAEDSGILEGDSVVKVALVKTNQVQGAGVSDVEQQFEVKTECFSYDATVDAILSLPPAQSEDETFVVTLKRLRRKPKVIVKLQYPPSQNEPDTTLELFSGEILRQAMLVRGVKLNDPLARRFDNKAAGNCGASGLCTTCAVSILKGGELLNPMKNSERQMMAANPRWRLACKTVVGFGMQEGEITVRVNPRQWDDYFVEEKYEY
jgi:ferredoxin